METSEADKTVDNHSHLAKLAQYTKHRMSEDGVETENASSSSSTQETKPKNPAPTQNKKRTIEPEIAEMEAEVVDPVQVLVPAGEDSDSFTDWTQAN